jgi:hypothetical protein
LDEGDRHFDHHRWSDPPVPELISFHLRSHQTDSLLALEYFHNFQGFMLLMF